MLNRVAFSPDWTKEQYKHRVSIIAGLFTLVTTPVVGLFFGAPILAIIAIFAARDYADWYYEGEEKSKHDFTRLLDGEECESTLEEDEEASKPKKFQHYRLNQ
jgi:hypothetical protein